MDSEPKEELDIYEREGETLGDISSMLRRLAESGNCSQEYPGGAFSSSSNDLATWVSCLADRIDAAAKREQADLADAHDAIARLETELAEARRERDSCAAENSLLARAPGNAAALREAAERICYLSPTEAQDLRQLAQFCHNQSIYGGGLIERVLDDIEIVRQALSTPPRNCDAIPADEMCRAFKHANCDQYENSSEDPRTCCEGRCVECIVKWMLKEHKEGDAEEDAPQARHGYGTPDMAGMGVVNGG